MLILRSLAFNVAFYANIITWMIAILPTLAMPRGAVRAMIRLWSRSNLLLLRTLAGIHLEVRGLDHLPPGGFLVAAKHQSSFETIALLHLFRDPCMIMKQELMWLPLFGWLARKAGMISVNRGARSAALRAMNLQAKQELAAGRQILIFPEGTRRPPGAPPAYKFGVSHLYAEMGVPCVPIALNSGLFWPRRQWLRHPGTIVVELLDPLPAGMKRAEFRRTVEAQIEAACARLIDEALAAPNPPPKPQISVVSQQMKQGR